VGVRGTDVRQLQQALSAIGYDPGPIDGVFGSKTAAAVKAFQAARGIQVDGVIGPSSRRTLATVLGASESSGALSPSARILRPGDRGDDVRAIQTLLSTAGFDPGPVDGVYGPLTESAVAKFQRRAGILVDGKVGPVTRRALSTELGVTAGSC
jgi:peptidoglycan hydrolase-like protein with peptidoglycan-binding domain